jgi:hypothetical protein
MGILEKIQEIEQEIARTQKNKATEYHLGLLKAKLARYRSQLLEAPKSSGSKVWCLWDSLLSVIYKLSIMIIRYAAVCSLCS